MKKEMAKIVKQKISITEEQKEWLLGNYRNCSVGVRDCIDMRMKLQKDSTINSYTQFQKKEIALIIAGLSNETNKITVQFPNVDFTNIQKEVQALCQILL